MTAQFPVTDAAAEAALTAITSALAGVLSVYTKNVQVTGSLTVADPTGVTTGSTVTINTDSLGALGIKLSGAPAGATVLFQGSVDGITWDNPKAYPLTVGSAGVQSASAAGDFEVNCAAFKQFRVCLSALTSGSFAVVINGTAAIKHVGVKNGNPADLQATITPAGATLTDRSSVVNSAVTGATVVAGGSGGTNGTQTVTGTTGTGTKFQASVTVASGAITAVLSITVAGSYTVLPTNAAAEPVTGAGLTGATLGLTMASVSTQLAAANSSRKGWRLQNTSSGDQWFNDTGGSASIGGAGCFKVASLGYYETPVGGASQAAISIYGATSSQTFSASEW
jgi:hypothetical protein